MEIKGSGLGFGRILRGVRLWDRSGTLVGGRQIGSCGVGLGAMVARRAQPGLGRAGSVPAGYVDYLDEVASAPFAITGYCMGGRVGWRIAAAYPERVAALAALHAGGLVSDDEDSPHLSASEISAELYLGHADNDQSMTPEHVAALEQALEEAGVRYRSELYEGAAHGYTMSDTAAYDEAAAERHFTELFELLDRTIGG
jgi:dienelactone hydrolase